MDTMKDLDMPFEIFALEVVAATPYEFTPELLREFYDDGFTVQDTIDWAEWKLDEAFFSESL